MRTAVTGASGTTLPKIVAAAAFAETLARLRDFSVAIEVLQEEHGPSLEELVGQLRLLAAEQYRTVLRRCPLPCQWPAGESVSNDR